MKITAESLLSLGLFVIFFCFLDLKKIKLNIIGTSCVSFRSMKAFVFLTVLQVTI